MQDMKKRTREFALQVVRLYASLPRGAESAVFGRQLLRSGTSVGAHYREGCRAKSNADFVSKLEGALQELEETEYWLELLAEAGIVSSKEVQPLLDEAEQLIAMFVAMTRKIKQKAEAR